MFDLSGNERIIEWKKIRDNLETSQTPFEDVLDLWKKAPFVNSYLDKIDSRDWPDPWHLVIDGKYDSIALCLGIAYTLQLTQRFMKSKFEIHTSINNKDMFYVIVDNSCVFDIEFRNLFDIKELDLDTTKLIWTSEKIK